MAAKNRFELLALGVGATCVLLVLALMPPLAQASPPALPPRPVPTATPPPYVTPMPKPPTAGATIELHVVFPETWSWEIAPWYELWTVVQWQDEQGFWHDVTGWQGTLEKLVNGEGRQSWWVGAEILGSGPFRWQVYSSENGLSLGQSEYFHLPGAGNQVLTVEVVPSW